MINYIFDFSVILPIMINYVCLVVFVIHGYILILTRNLNLVPTQAYFLVTHVPTNVLILKHMEFIYIVMSILLSIFFYFLVPTPMSPFQQKKLLTLVSTSIGLLSIFGYITRFQYKCFFSFDISY